MKIPVCSLVFVAAKYNDVKIIGFDRQKLRRLARRRDKLVKQLRAYRHFNKKTQRRLQKKALMTYWKIEQLEQQVESCRLPQDIQSQKQKEFADARRGNN